MKAGFPTTLSQDIEELRKVNRKNAHGHTQGKDSPEVAVSTITESFLNMVAKVKSL